jgi:ATP-dependent RNA helicase RhlE
MQAALDAARFHTPTPIQAQTIEPAMAGRDVIGTAQTGTGKTAAFMIPIVERLRGACDGPPRHRSALVLAPTRELAEQIHQEALRLGCGLRTAIVVGGMSFGPQIRALQNRPSIIVATPGRLVDHIERGTPALREVNMLVLDEADRMLDMGFKPQLNRILGVLPASRQTMLFSATMPAELGNLVNSHVRNPVRVDVGELAKPPAQAIQDVYVVDRPRKTPLLLSLLEQSSGTVLIFCRTKHLTDRLARTLMGAGHAAQRLHANRSQSQRREALEGFRGGRYRVLVATDVASRGIDVAGIGRVINYDLPTTVEDYVHRIGRTARAGAGGHATSFAAPDEHSQLRAIERHIGHALPRQKDGAGPQPVAHRPQAPLHADAPVSIRVHAPAVRPNTDRRNKPRPPKRVRFTYRDQRSA